MEARARYQEYHRWIQVYQPEATTLESLGPVATQGLIKAHYTDHEGAACLIVKPARYQRIYEDEMVQRLLIYLAIQAVWR